MKLEIKNRYDGSVIYSGEADTIRDLLVAAVKARANLRGADLCGANLQGNRCPGRRRVTVGGTNASLRPL
jgi:uncharacterized protein YjbI with pentapeptide repeats